MSSSQASKILCKLLIELAHEELSIDLHRQSLWQEIGSNLKSLYPRDLSPADLYSYLHDNYHDDVKLTECVSLINYFDSNSNAKLGFDDFFLIILPWRDKGLRKAMKQARENLHHYKHHSLPVSQDCEILLSSLFKREIDLLRIKNALLEDLQSVSELTPLELFKLLDKHDALYINYLGIRDFLYSHGHYATDDELIAIIRRIDTDNDSYIDYKDFVQFITINVAMVDLNRPEINKGNYKEDLNNQKTQRFYASNKYADKPEPLNIETEMNYDFSSNIKFAH